MKRYVNADIVLDRAKSSLKTYFDRDVIIAEEYYKVIEHCNQILGLKLNKVKDVLIDFNNGIGRLPDDFLFFEAAVAVCDEGVKHSYRIKKSETLDSRPPTNEELKAHKCGIIKLECLQVPVVIEEFEDYYIEYNNTKYFTLTQNKYISDTCLNKYYSDKLGLVINTDNNTIVVDSNIKKAVIRYIASMTEDTIPLCLDNEIVLRYYEEAVKYEMLRDLVMNRKTDLAQMLQLSRTELATARGDAISFVSTEGFNEMARTAKLLRSRYKRRNRI